MPDHNVARESEWVPFIAEKLKLKETPAEPDADTRVYLIGHSSGAVCLMRFLEKYVVDGVILVSGAIDDLGEANETASGYYPQQPGTTELRPWSWDLMKKNVRQFIVHIGSSDDCFIPVSHMREIKSKLGLIDEETYWEYDDQSHFMVDRSPEIEEIVKGLLVKHLAK